MKTTTGRGTTRTVKAAAAGMAGLAILTAGLSGCASTQATSQVAVEDKQAGGVLKIAEWLGEEVAGAGVHIGVDALFELLTGAGEGAEDPNKERFEEVNTQLEGLSEQLTVMQESVTTLISKTDNAAYKDTLIALRGYGNSVEALYNDRFMPIVDANQKLVDDKAAGADDATLQADRAAVAAATAKFQAAYQTGEATYAPQAKNIHDFLTPGGASVLHDKGQALMDKGYITRTDSEELRAVYDLWADYEATAVLMSSFYASIDSGNTAAQNKLDTWSTWRTQELDELPPAVPVGHIVTTPNASLEGATEFAPALAGHDSDGTLTRETTWVATGPTGYLGGAGITPDSPKWWLYTGDLRAEGDAAGWKLPSQTQFKQLTDKTQGFEPRCATTTNPASCDLMNFALAKTIGDQSSYAWQGAWSPKHYWVTDTTANDFSCQGGTRRYIWHNVADLSGAAASFRPSHTYWGGRITELWDGTGTGWLPDEYTPAWCDEGRLSTSSLPAGVLLTNAPADYMAQE